MSRSTLTAAGVILLLALCLGCGQEEEGQVIARIGSETITEADILTRLEGMPPFVREQLKSPEGRQRLIQALVEERILYKDALAKGLDKTEAYQREIEQREVDILVGMYYERVIESAAAPSDDAVTAYYESHQADFTVPEAIRGRHILVETKSEAQRLRGLLDGGADFAELAKQHSLDPMTSERQGIIHGEIKRGQHVKGLGDLPELVEVFFQMEEGEISDPVRTEKGYHVLRVDTRTPASVRPFDEVKPEIVSMLTGQRRNAVRDSVMAELKTKYRVEFVTEDQGQPETPEAMFKAASEESEPQRKIERYRGFIEKYPDDERAYEAKFMIGFTMAEDLKDFDAAEREFEDFLERYPESDLSDDAKWMLENMRSGSEPDFGSE